MPGSTPLQLYAYPITSDQASPAAVQTLAQAIEKQVVAIFADAATRDSRWTSATGLANGALCFLNSTGELQLRSGGAWIVIGGRASPYAVNTGTATANVTSGGGPLSVTVTFAAGRFSVAPNVWAQVNSSAGGAIGASTLVFSGTTTGCTIQIAPAGATWGATMSIFLYWQAIQMSSASGTG